ncbi:HAD family hydrolase [Vibrio parahaemolyticus]|nr:HAD family hydrolase [Vibrio parahaemolyticus]
MPRVARFERRKVAYIDVDGTLFLNGSLNNRLVTFLHKLKSNGWEINLWSANGKEYAERAAAAANCSNLFESILSKPSLVVDDLGWSWVKHTECINPMEIPT